MPRRAAAVRREAAGRKVQQPSRHAAHQQGSARRQEVIAEEHRLRRPFDLVQEKTGEDDASTVFKKAMDNVRPTLEVAPFQACRRRHLPGPDRGQLPPFHHAGYPLDRRLLPCPQGAQHGPAPRRRDHGRFQRPGRIHQEARRPLQDGRIQPCILALSLVGVGKELTWQEDPT